MASKGQSSKRGSSLNDGKRSAPSRSGDKPAQSAGSRGGSRNTHSGSSGRKNGSSTDR